MRRKSELEGRETLGYYRSCELVASHLVKSIEKLRERNATTRDQAEIMANRGRILSLKADKGRLEVRRMAFEENRHAIRPPTHAHLDELDDQIRDVEALSPDCEVADEIMRLAADTMRIFNVIHPAQG